jgi:hypothetical protein
MEWKENSVSWDLKTKKYQRHVVFDNIKLVVIYHKLYENSVVIDEVQTPDGTNITSLVRDRSCCLVLEGNGGCDCDQRAWRTFGELDEVSQKEVISQEFDLTRPS